MKSSQLPKLLRIHSTSMYLLQHPLTTSWGASIIDSLDTLLLLGLKEEYNQARPHINKVNFQWINGHDYINGFVSPLSPPPSHDSSRFYTPTPPATRWTQHRDRSVALPVFETGIRYLGGFLGAYDLTGDQLLLDRAVELAGILGKAFMTPPGLPLGRIEPGRYIINRATRLMAAHTSFSELDASRWLKSEACHLN